MKKFLIKYNLEILSTLMFLFVTASAIFNVTPSITQKMLIAYVFLFTLHEWEENRFPGGFVKIMEGMIGKKFSEDAKELSHIPVIKDIDPNAFISQSAVIGVFGEGFDRIKVK